MFSKSDGTKPMHRGIDGCADGNHSFGEFLTFLSKFAVSVTVFVVTVVVVSVLIL